MDDIDGKVLKVDRGMLDKRRGKGIIGVEGTNGARNAIGVVYAPLLLQASLVPTPLQPIQVLVASIDKERTQTGKVFKSL